MSEKYIASFFFSPVKVALHSFFLALLGIIIGIIATLVGFNRRNWIRRLATLEAGEIAGKHIDLSLLLKLAHWLVLLRLRGRSVGSRSGGCRLIVVLHHLGSILLDEFEQHQQNVVRKLINVQFDLSLLGTLLTYMLEIIQDGT